MMTVLWTEHKNNEEILTTVNSKRNMIINISTRHARFKVHTMRKKKLEHLVSTEKIEMKRS